MARLILSGTVVLAGCLDGNMSVTGRPGTTRPARQAADGWGGLSSLASGKNPASEDQLTPSEQRKLIAVRIGFDILLARVASGVFSESGKVWNHLDEEAIPADRALLLQRNGLRVALGRQNAWPPIRAILEQAGQVETSRDRIIVDNGSPLIIDVQGPPRDQTLFLFRPDGSLGAASFPKSRNVLRVEYDIALTTPDAIRAAVMPEIRLPPRAIPREPGLPGIRPPAWEEPARVLRELAFEMQIGPEEFFVVGPSPLVALAGREHLAGTLLLCTEIEGRSLESMYFITPRLLHKGFSDGF